MAATTAKPGLKGVSLPGSRGIFNETCDEVTIVSPVISAMMTVMYQDLLAGLPKSIIKLALPFELATTA